MYLYSESTAHVSSRPIIQYKDVIIQSLCLFLGRYFRILYDGHFGILAQCALRVADVSAEHAVSQFPVRRFD
jgi:hypothetical protein